MGNSTCSSSEIFEDDLIQVLERDTLIQDLAENIWTVSQI